MKYILSDLQKHNTQIVIYFGQVALVAYIFFINQEQINARHFFHADDWAWLYKAEFMSFKDIFSIFPRAIYNDRPVGAITIKALYQIFGLNSQGFLYFQILLHILNCFLIYFISKKYIGNYSALIVGALAGSWFVANNAVFWTAAIFDLLGATLCLLVIFFWQKTQTKKHIMFYSIVGAFIYFLAIRTKEFSLGLPVLLFIMSTTLDKKSIIQTLQLLVPFIIVMFVFGARYIYLLFYSGTSLLNNSDSSYGLHFSGILDNIWFYFSKSFYSDAFGLFGVYAVLFSFVLIGIITPRIRMILFFCLSGYLILLGPTLLLSSQLSALYLYAPHFFLAFAVGGLFLAERYWKIFGFIISLALIIMPPSSKLYHNGLNFHEAKSSVNRDQFNAFISLFDVIEKDSTIFISGVERYHNPFSYGPGNSVKINNNDTSLKFKLERPFGELKAEFCETAPPKYFIDFKGVKAINKTQVITESCEPPL